MLKRILVEPAFFALMVWLQFISLRRLEKLGALGRRPAMIFSIFSTALIVVAVLLNPVLGLVPARSTQPLLRALLLIWSILTPLSIAAYALGQSIASPHQAGRRIAVGALCAAPWAVTSFGIVVGRRDFQLNEVKVHLPGLPRALDGLRIAQLTDIHYGPFLSAADLRHVVGMANEGKPHLAVVTGDLITNRSELLGECLDTMRDLRATLGVYGCHGNHESYAHCEADASRLSARFGWRYLRGETAKVQWNGAEFFLSGVDYPWIPEIYLEELTQAPQPGETHLLLSHNPDTFPVAAQRGYALQLSGHTHGGQVNIDVLDRHLNAVSLVTPYTRGLYEIQGRRCFVSSGIGTIGVPLRIGAPPEVALIQLCAS
jgi:uncharacterized protein